MWIDRWKPRRPRGQRTRGSSAPGSTKLEAPNWVNFGFGNGGHRYPGKIDSAHAGEELANPRLPLDVPLVPNQQNPFAGLADYYQLRYGPYLIAMNTTREKKFELTVPADLKGVKQAVDLVANKTLALTKPLKVAPRSTVVL